MDSNRIKNYRRLGNWENYFICSAICSIGKSLGSKNDDFHLYAAFTGDMFAYLYPQKIGNPDNLQCDSGITNYFYNPMAVKKAFAVFGYDCIYYSNLQIKNDFKKSMDTIKTSIDKGIPVLAWGMGNVTMKDGTCYDPLPEGCLIGGYDKDDVLYVNLYPGPERLLEGSVDNDGYTAIINGLNTTKGLFFVGDKIENVDMQNIYHDAIFSIPSYLTLPVAENDLGGKYVFGKTAFETWAETIITNSFFEGKNEDELSGICWNLHCSPYCCVCTSNAYDFLKGVTEQYPNFLIVEKILPLYKKMQDYKDEIWEMHGDFFPPMEKFKTQEFRVNIAEILRCMGSICDEIVSAFVKI
jgi:hypothetical protein